MSTLLTASILLLVLWPAYASLLRYSDRYALNRLLLVLGMVAVGGLPFVSFESPAPAVTRSVRGSINLVEEAVYRAPVVSPPVTEPTITEEAEVSVAAAPVAPPPVRSNPLTVLYLGGAALMLALLLGRMLFILTLHLRSRPKRDADYRLLHAGASPGQAFTFGANIYFSEDVPAGPDFSHILNHERVHARQLHTVDILLAEVFLCFFWFHPTAWWLRTQTRANLEYLVDKAVVRRGADRRDYQLALVRQSVAAQGLALALPFSEPSLKSRISRLTGLPGYRAIGILAAVALTLWMGVGVAVLNGSSGADAGAGEYLAAAAAPGDPYHDYYAAAFPEGLTSLEIFTNRMVTVDEYLQLRAIVARVPGTRLYVYKQPFDKYYTLELQRAGQEPAVIRQFGTRPTREWTYLLGMKPAGSAGEMTVTATKLQRNHVRPGRDTTRMTYKLTNEQSVSWMEMTDIAPLVEAEEIVVFANGQRLYLGAYESDARVNGRRVSDLAPFAWPEIVVEGRQIPTPQQRLTDILAKGDKTNRLKIHRTNRRGADGTYRRWFEDLRLHNGDETGMARRYNDRFARLDFLLDTDFGPNSMIQVGYRTDRPGGMILVQVIDDTPQRVIDRALTDDRTRTLNIYLKRLPTPEEVEFIRPYLTGFPGYELLLYQSCTDKPDTYTLHLGRADQVVNGYSGWEAGGVFAKPKQLQLTRYGQAGISPLILGQTDWPEGAPNRNVLLEIDGQFIGVPERAVPDYDVAKMDEPIAHERLRCLLGLTPANNLHAGEWIYVHRASGPETLEYLEQSLESAGLVNRPRRYFIGEREVDRYEFATFEETPGAYAQVGALKQVAGSEVILQIIDSKHQ